MRVMNDCFCSCSLRTRGESPCRSYYPDCKYPVTDERASVWQQTHTPTKCFATMNVAPQNILQESLDARDVLLLNVVLLAPVDGLQVSVHLEGEALHIQVEGFLRLSDIFDELLGTIPCAKISASHPFRGVIIKDVVWAFIGIRRQGKDILERGKLAQIFRLLLHREHVLQLGETKARLAPQKFRRLRPVQQTSSHGALKPQEPSSHGGPQAQEISGSSECGSIMCRKEANSVFAAG